MIHDNAHNVTRVKKKPWLLIVGLFLLTGFLPLAYIYGPVLYHRYSGDSQYRIEQQTIKWAKQIQSKKFDPVILLKEISESQKVVEIIQYNKPLDSNIRILKATLVFYKLMIRMPIDDNNLMLLTGRGYMPLSQKIPGDKNRLSSIQSAKKIIVITKRAIALDPQLENKDKSNLLLLYGDFIFTGRTDPQLLIRLREIDPNRLPEHIRPWYEWIAISLFTLMGQTNNAREILENLVIKNNHKKDDAQTKNHLKMSEANHQLILCHSFFYNKNYLLALRQARFVKNNKLLSASTRSEAARMEAEIFLKQRGRASALFFFNQALEISELEDPFIQERINELSQ